MAEFLQYTLRTDVGMVYALIALVCAGLESAEWFIGSGRWYAACWFAYALLVSGLRGEYIIVIGLLCYG
jgi:hypothetical protein